MKKLFVLAILISFFYFGFVSATTISLTEDETENMDDVWLRYSASEETYGIFYMKFNISMIPADQIIESATLGLYGVSSVGGSVTINMYRITGAWDELSSASTIYSASSGDGISFSSADIDTVGDWNLINLTSYVQSAYGNSSSFVSFKLVPPESGMDEKTDNTFLCMEGAGPVGKICYKSAEHGDTSDIPFLNITYSGISSESSSSIWTPGGNVGTTKEDISDDDSSDIVEVEPPKSNKIREWFSGIWKSIKKFLKW